MDMAPRSRNREKGGTCRKGGDPVYDPFHVVQLATTALDKVRREVWQDLRKLPDKDAARRFKGARLGAFEEPDRSHRRPGCHFKP